MAEDFKISGLPRVTQLPDDTLFPVVTEGDNYAATAQTIKSYVTGGVNLEQLNTAASDAWFELLARQALALGGGRVTVNREAKTFSLHGINDVTVDEMIRIIATPWISGADYYNPYIRTAPLWRALGSAPAKTLKGCFYSNPTIETVENMGIQLDGLNNSFVDCGRLRSICSIANPLYAGWVSDFSKAFSKLPKLEYVGIEIGNCTGLSFADSPLLTRQCLADIVSRAKNTKPITITVHPDVYAKLTGDTTNEAVAAMPADELSKWRDVLAAADSKKIVMLPPCKRLSFYGGVKVLTPVECQNIPAYGHRENWHNWVKDDNVSVGDLVLIDTMNSDTREYGYIVARLMGIYDETGGYNTPHYINTFSLHGASVDIPGRPSAAIELANELLAPGAGHETTDDNGNIITP